MKVVTWRHVRTFGKSYGKSELRPRPRIIRREKVTMEIQTGGPKSETINVLRWDSRLMYLACFTRRPRRNRFPIRIYSENILEY